MQPRTRQAGIGSGSARAAPIRLSSELHVVCSPPIASVVYLSWPPCFDGISAKRRWLRAGTQAVKARSMQPRTRRDGIGSGSARTDLDSGSSELYAVCSRSIASVVYPSSPPLTVSASKAVVACGYASSEGQGDAAAYQTSWHRLRVGQDSPHQPKQRATRGVLAFHR